jgi:hypothetical protein
VKKRHLPLACLLIVASLALAACGSSSSSDEDQIEEAIQTAATSEDPTNCTELSTLAFVEQSQDGKGQKAIEECEKEAEEGGDEARSVAVSKVKVDGEDASADVEFSGGGFDGQVLALGLVKEDDQWKLDEITGFAKLDKAVLVKTLGAQFESTGEIGKGQIDCILAGIEEASQEEVEELLLSGSSEQFVALAEGCA